MNGPAAERVLVIKLSALGDFILSLGAFQAIRQHHPDAEVILLTTPPYADLAGAWGGFDQVWTDSRPRLGDLRAWLALARQLRRGGFKRVYDLQRSERSGWYFRLLARPKPEWVGVVAGCSHRYEPPKDPQWHIQDREAAQLALAGISAIPPAELAFLDGDVAPFGLPARYALLAPGGAAHRPGKRWPAAGFAGIAARLSASGVLPLLLGTAAEADALAAIARDCPGTLNLCDQTDLSQIATLARGACAAVGNDTGPMHLIAAAGCPVVSLFSAESEPAKVAPRGPAVTLLRCDDLANLTIDSVWEALLGAFPSNGYELHRPGQREC